jgi:hypothetical protein
MPAGNRAACLLLPYAGVNFDWFDPRRATAALLDLIGRI